MPITPQSASVTNAVGSTWTKNFSYGGALDDSSTPENDSNEILTQVIGLTCSGQTGRIHLADFDVWGLAEQR